MADDPSEKPPPPCAIGIEISVDRQRCAVGKAYRADERITAEVAYYGSPAVAAAWIGERYAADDPVAVAVDPKSQTATLIKPLTEWGVSVIRLSAEDVAVAHGEFMDLVASRGLRHLGQEELTAAVRAAQQRSLAGAKAWERFKVDADQAPLNACTFAVWALQRYEELASPGVWQI